MNSKIVSIGNSKGVRLPKSMIDDWTDDQELTIEKRGETIVITPRKIRRENWIEEILSCDGLKEEIINFPNDFDEKEWTW